MVDLIKRRSLEDSRQIRPEQSLDSGPPVIRKGSQGNPVPRGGSCPAVT
jgi:hypothetical protein